eukprot:g56991.t1
MDALVLGYAASRGLSMRPTVARSFASTHSFSELVKSACVKGFDKSFLKQTSCHTTLKEQLGPRGETRCRSQGSLHGETLFNYAQCKGKH